MTMRMGTGRAMIAAMMLLPGGSRAAAPAPSFSCPAVQPMPREMHIQTRYAGRQVDPTFSTLDADKVAGQKEERRKFDGPVVRINNLAEMWRTAQSPDVQAAIGACLARHFAALPAADAMADAPSDYDAYYRDWMLSSLAISYLKARPALDADESAPRVRDWFGAMADRTIAFYRGRDRIPDNHLYWGAVTAAAISRITGSAPQADFARDVLGKGLGQVDAAGLLPAEVARGQRARHYHVFAAVPLAAIAILLGEPVETVNAAGFRRLVTTIIASLEAPDGGAIGRAAGAAQLPETSMSPLTLLRPFAADDAALAARLDRLIAGAQPYSYFLGGRIDYLIDMAGHR